MSKLENFPTCSWHVLEQKFCLGNAKALVFYRAMYYFVNHVIDRFGYVFFFREEIQLIMSKGWLAIGLMFCYFCML